MQGPMSEPQTVFRDALPGALVSLSTCLPGLGAADTCAGLVLQSCQLPGNDAFSVSSMQGLHDESL